ncbi:MAG TPA: DUF202 domain-containing protein [Ktedonobacterales bacterium]|nr:DUF202 domain-containing protein [Ktedonobacterales bacterium]
MSDEEMARSARPADSAARDHLANERTLLAWARASIAVMALGFVVARFGLLIRELGALPPRALPTGASTAFGVALTVAGALLMGTATVRYGRIGRMIERGEFRWSPGLGLALGSLLVVVALLLAAYLLISA